MSLNTGVTSIRGISERRRLPRLGKIRLGIKVTNKSGAEYPKEVPYFVIPPETDQRYPQIKQLFGEQPTELDIMFPLNDREAIFPQALKFYGSGRGLKCKGDKERALQFDAEKKELIEVDCPCDLLEKGKCKQAGVLHIMLPSVSLGGYFQIITSSYNSIVDINSGIDHVKSLTWTPQNPEGFLAFVPLKLRRTATTTHHEGKRQTHYTLSVAYEGTENELNMLKYRAMQQLSLQLPSEPEPSMPMIEDRKDVKVEDTKIKKIEASIEVVETSNDWSGKTTLRVKKAIVSAGYPENEISVFFDIAKEKDWKPAAIVADPDNYIAKMQGKDMPE